MADATKLLLLGTLATMLAPLTWWGIKREFNGFIGNVREFIPDEKALKLYNQDHPAQRMALRKKAEELRARLKRV